jgi:hypothetical protein
MWKSRAVAPKANPPQLCVWAVSPDEGNFLFSQSSLAAWPSTGH